LSFDLPQAMLAPRTILSLDKGSNKAQYAVKRWVIKLVMQKIALDNEVKEDLRDGSRDSLTQNST